MALLRAGSVSGLIYGFESLGQIPTSIPVALLAKAVNYGILAAASYTDALYDDAASQFGWVEKEIFDNPSGMRAVLYERHGEYVLAYAGTEPSLLDVRADVMQGWIGTDAQYFEAINLVDYVRSQYSDNLHLVGHSLGGGLASAAALVHGIKASTFNAAGVHPRTISPFQATLFGHTELIDAFRVRGEALTTLQDTGQPYGLLTAWFGPGALLSSTFGYIMPDSVGRNYYLASDVLNPLSRHSRPSYLAALFNNGA